jgi:hypothetical protein
VSLGTPPATHAEATQPAPDHRQPREADESLRQDREDQQQTGHAQREGRDRPLDATEPVEGPVNDGIDASRFECGKGEAVARSSAAAPAGASSAARRLRGCGSARWSG